MSSKNYIKIIYQTLNLILFFFHFFHLLFLLTKHSLKKILRSERVSSFCQLWFCRHLGLLPLLHRVPIAMLLIIPATFLILYPALCPKLFLVTCLLSFMIHNSSCCDLNLLHLNPWKKGELMWWIAPNQTNSDEYMIVNLSK